jgi:hypothetical protein
VRLLTFDSHSSSHSFPSELPGFITIPELLVMEIDHTMDTFSDDLSSASIFQKRLVVQCGVLLLCIVTCIAVAFLAFPKKKMRKTKHASYSKQKSQSWWSKIVWGRRKIETKEDRERRAKASFRVKRSDLRPKTRSRANRSGFHNAKRTQQQRRITK